MAGFANLNLTPEQIQQLIALLSTQQMGLPTSAGFGAAPAAAPVSAASVPTSAASGGAAIGGGAGTPLGALTGGGFGSSDSTSNMLLRPAEFGAEGFAVGGPVGSAVGLAGGWLMDLMDLISGGVPREQKTAEIGQAALQSGDPLEALIGRFIGQGVGQGRVVSESGSNTFEGAVGRLGAFLEALTGQDLPSTVSGTSFGLPQIGKVAQKLQLPAGYEFANDPSKYDQMYRDIQQFGLSGPSGAAQSEAQWKKLVNELIAQGVLKRYQGSLGAAGGGPMGTGGIPNVALPHPLAQQGSGFTPYPV